MTADRYATRFSRMLKLSVTSFSYHQSPPVGFEHPNHITYLHVRTISQKRKSDLPFCATYHSLYVISTA